MTRDDIIRMARDAGLDPDLWNFTDAFERFAALVSAAEREECAQVADECADNCYDGDLDWYEAKRIAKAIRARGNT